MRRPPGCSRSRLETWIAIALCVGCGQLASPTEPVAAAPARESRPTRSDRGAPGRAAPADRPAAPGDAQRLPERRSRENQDDRGERKALEAHNRLRARHCAKPLAWSAALAEFAQRWANALRDKGCAFGHSNGEHGENLAAGTSGTLDAEAVVKMWYDEVAHYRFPNGGFSMKTGHFTQLVWRGTARVGCGRSQCNGMDIWVCEYDPPGNWEGQYRDNVLPAGCR